MVGVSQDSKLIVEEYELGPVAELQLEDLVHLRVWTDSTIVSKRAKWRSEKSNTQYILQHELYSKPCVIELPSKKVTIEILEREAVGMEEEIHVLVSEDGQSKCDILAKGSPVTGAFQTAFPWKNTCVLEFTDMVYLGCTNQNEALGYSAIFHYRIVAGRPMYFFKSENDYYGISFDGSIVSIKYDEIVRNMCCDYALLCPRTSESMVWFYAKRDGKWYYVEAGLFE